MSDKIRYTGNSVNDKILRLALLTAWNSTCYWCGKPRDFNEVEIDHLIPRKLAKKDRDALLKDLLRGDSALEEAYDVDAPPNLAPICGNPCNREKSDTLFNSGRFESKFKMARGKADEVEKWVRSFRSSNKVAKAVLALATADLDDPRAKESLTGFAPILDARIRHLNYVTEEEHFDPYQDDTRQATLKIDETGRRSIILFEDLHGVALDQGLLPAIRTTRLAISKNLASQIEANVSRQGHDEPEAGTLFGDIDIWADGLRYDRDAERFELTGSFEADVAADVWVTDLNGSRDDTVQETASGRGNFSVWFLPDPQEASDSWVTLEWKEEGNRSNAPVGR